MLLRVTPPAGELRGLVRSYGLREVDLGSDARRLVFPARTDQMLEFYLGDAPKVVLSHGATPLAVPGSVLVGTQALGRVELFLSGAIRTFTISFTPTGFNQLFGMPMSEFAGKGVAARDVLGLCVHDLRERLGNASEFAAMVGEANEFLRPFALRAAATRDRFLNAIQSLSRTTVARAASVDDWAFETGLGQRQFERRFKASVGVSPKRYLRVRRFETALQLKESEQSLSWGHIASECGYYDQMHLVHEFKELGGEAPSTLIREVRERIDFTW